MAKVRYLERGGHAAHGGIHAAYATRRQKENPTALGFPKNNRRNLEGTSVGLPHDVEGLYDQRERERHKRLDDFLKATKALPDERDDTGSLADKFLLSTYELPRALHRAGNGRARDYEPVMLRYRAAIRRARRFALTREFVETVTAVSSSTTPDKLLARLPLAVLPFETTWIEFDLQAKVRTTQRLAARDDATNVVMAGPADTTGDPDDVTGVPERMGVLLQRDGARASKFRMTMTGPTDSLEAPHMLAYDVDTAPDANVTSSKLTPDDSTLSTRRMRALPWGYVVASKHATVEQVPEGILRHGAPCYSDLFWTIAGLVSKDKTASLASHVMEEAVANSGMVRWVVTLLAMLADVPLYASERVEPPGLRRVGTQLKPRMDFHRLSIKLPKLHAVRYVERRLDKTSIKHRAHEVRTHWRTFLAEFHCTRDAHRWEYSEDATHRACQKCRSRGTLIKEHVRGDESLGWVQKDYILERNRRAT